MAALGLALAIQGRALAADLGEQLSAFAFDPKSIGPAGDVITISFQSRSDELAYVEVSFVDPSRTFRCSGSTAVEQTKGATSHIRLKFEPFMPPGTWTVADVLLMDKSGNTQMLDGGALSGRGFPVRLEIQTRPDSAGPRIETLQIVPPRVDITRGAADTELRYLATDDSSGVYYIEAVLRSPSGAFTTRGFAKLNAARRAEGTLTVRVPRSSEAGRWTLDSVFLADAVGRTLILDSDELARAGFDRAIDVTLIPDTAAPKLSMIDMDSLTGPARRPASVRVKFAASDEGSGVKSVEVVLISPSGSMTERSRTTYSPAVKVEGIVELKIPEWSEVGEWSLHMVVVTDASGNTVALERHEISRLARRTTIQVE